MQIKIGATLAVLAMGAVVLAGQPVVAKGGHGGRAGHGQLQKLTQELNLTADQKAQIKTILADAATKRQAIKAGDAAARPAALKALRKETMASIRALLTPDQIAKLKAMRQARRGAAGTATP